MKIKLSLDSNPEADKKKEMKLYESVLQQLTQNFPTILSKGKDNFEIEI